MKKIYNRFTASILSAMISLSSATAFLSFAESGEAEVKQITVHFDISEEGVTISKDEDGNTVELTDIVSNPNNSVQIPECTLLKDGFVFSGWTVDGVRGYPSNTIMQVGEEDVTLSPVWTDPTDKNYHLVKYEVEHIEDPDDLPVAIQPVDERKGSFVEVSLFSFDHPENTHIQLGWNYDGTTYLGQQYIIMPDHDIVLTPNWLKFYKLTYTPGDVDRIVGTTSSIFDRIEKQQTDLAEAGRFSRIGFRNTGWKCDADDKIYAPLSAYMMPSQDVTFTAVWEPINYVVVFNSSTGNSEDNYKIEGKTDTTIICPEMKASKSGYYFDGWKFSEKIDGKTVTTIYKAGDEFLIKGAKPGLGISLTAVWVKGEPPTDTPDVKYGDANADGNIALSDAIMIMQVIGNPDSYGMGGSDPSAITENGFNNADCCNPGDGLTNLDALAIQKYLLKLIPELPETN
ncbi:MAG: dockerin type I repeat-containing protein [Ruminococcus sp.]|nr:dockerin type I repeat-containing protein [Ruminococcus sp.]